MKITRRTDAAMKSFNAAINVDDQNGLAYLERGRLFLEMHKSSKAENDFKKALSLGNEQAKEMLAGSMIDKRRSISSVHQCRPSV